MEPLLEEFVAHLPEEAVRSPEADAALGGTLRRVIDHARETWPDLAIPSAVFAAYLGARIPAGKSPVETLATLHVTDLYLACACANDVPGAVEQFDRQFAGTVEAFVRSVPGASSRLDDLQQALRTKLFVDAPDEPKKIAQYTGRGKLSSWIGVTVQRTALNLVRSDNARKETGLDDFSEAIPSGANPELDYLKARYRAEFREAFQQAVSELSQRERVVLRHHYVNGLSQERIARLYQANQATVSRWIASARESIRRTAERELRKRLNTSVSEIQSIAALIRSQFDLSLARYLESDSE